jgi:AraC family transcriptional regulator of adaptative response / DNA-3-methyladenine glycosylase II
MGLTDTFPTATTLASSRPEQFMALGFTEARAHAIINFASAVACDDVRLDRSVELDAFVASMTAVVGIGPWTAHYLALRMGERDAFPNSDLGLVRTATAIDRRITTPRELATRAEDWRPWRAHAATHLWLRPDEEGPTHEDVHQHRALAHR